MYDAALSMPYNKLPKKFRDVLLYGTGEKKLEYDYTNRSGYVQHRSHSFEGLVNNLERRYRATGSEWIKEKLEAFMSVSTCPSCQGNLLSRLHFLPLFHIVFRVVGI
jgi:excinuclease ABC subunit A